MVDTYRIILNKRHADYKSVCESATTYPYIYNYSFQCAEVDETSFLVIKLKYDIRLHTVVPEYANMPTYTILDPVTKVTV